jgi:hypothetical protein
MRPRVAARNIFQIRHGTAESAQSSTSFLLDQRFESFAKQCCSLGDAGEFLSNANQIIIKGESRSHIHSLRHHRTSGFVLTNNGDEPTSLL